jgi:hypothetical protein
MFNLFAPRCPLGAWEQAWTETRFASLVRIVGLPRLQSATVLLPTTEFFPRELIARPPHSPQKLLRVLQRHLGLDVGNAQVRLTHRGANAPLLLGSTTWSEPSIEVGEPLLRDAEALIAALVCELSRVYLARGGHYRADDPDGPWVAELLTVVLGAGVFVANTVMREEYQHLGYAWRWSMERRGNVPARMLGYAMALFAWARNERPRWSGHLRQDAAAALAEGLRYLQRGGDSLFDPQQLYAPREAPSPTELVQVLQSGKPARRMQALWQLAGQPGAGSAAEPALLRCLRDRNADLREEALRVLAALGVKSSAAIEALQTVLHDDEPAVRRTAAQAVAELRPDSRSLMQGVACLLEDPSPDVVAAAATALASFGRQADGQLNLVLQALRRGLVACQEPVVAAAVEALSAIAADPAYCLCEALSDDGELLDRAVRALRAYGRAG